ncbi:hypothetical protein HanIR_Chr07g0325791 [Helianthus annuus]|nr:hypothetical protein HanIR_Chr07g0325791 [Helianthus annuus]
MASPSKPSFTTPVNPDSPSSPTAEEEAEVNAPGKSLPVSKWTESSFQNLITIQMPAAYGARYPQEGDTAGDAPAGYVSMFADWFDVADWIGRQGLCGRKTKGKIEIVKCGPDEEGWNETILSNFRVPDEVALNDMLPEGKGHLGALGDPDAMGFPMVFANLVVDKQRRKKKGACCGYSSPLVQEAAEPLEEPVSASTLPSSPPKVVDAEAQKKGGEDPSIEVVSSEGTPPAVHAEKSSKKTGGDMIFDTLDSSNSLIDPRGEGEKGGEKPKSPVFEKVSGSAAAGKGVEDQPPIQPHESELDYYYRSYSEARSFTVHHPPGLENEKAAFEKLKQTERWAASAGLEQVRSLAKLLSEERKHWKEACARENEKLFRLRQELNNLKVANAALVKEKTAGEAAVKEAEARGAAALKEAEARAVNELADANADHTKRNKRVEELQAELKNRDIILGEVTSRATEAETRARQTEEERDGLATSLAQVNNDHAWMRQHGIGHILEAILDATENAATVTDMNERARQVGFRAGYDKCPNDVNLFFISKFTDERSVFHGVDTEAAFGATVDAYNNLSIPTLDHIKACLEVEDYVDRLRMLFNPVKEGEGTRGANVE